METPRSIPTPNEAAASLRLADSTGSGLAGALRLPSHFYSSLGTAITVQIGTAAVGVTGHDASGLALAAAGVALLFVVGAVQIRRFRAMNGVRVKGFESRVVGGTANTASTAYGFAFGGALWAALVGAWWLVAVASALGGIGYAGSGRLWWRNYQRDPAANSRGDSAVWLGILVVAAGGGMVALVIGS